MESLLVFGVIAAIFYLIVLPIIAFTASGRASEAQRMAEALKARLARAEAEIAAMRATTAGRVPEATPPAPVQDAAPVITAPIASPEPVREELVESPTLPEPAPIATAPQPLLVEASTTEPEARPAEPVVAPPPKPARPVVRKHEAQDANPLSGIFGWFFKGNPLAKIGSLLLFFGLAYQVM